MRTIDLSCDGLNLVSAMVTDVSAAHQLLFRPQRGISILLGISKGKSYRYRLRAFITFSREAGDGWDGLGEVVAMEASESAGVAGTHCDDPERDSGTYRTWQWAAKRQRSVADPGVDLGGLGDGSTV